MKVQIKSVGGLLRKCQLCGLTMSKQMILCLKKIFSITIFKKYEFVSKVAPFILSLNLSKRAFVAFGFFLPQQKLLENAKFQLRKLLFDRDLNEILCKGPK